MFNLQGKELIFDYTKRNTVHKPSVQSLCNFNFPIFLYHFLLTIDNPRWNGTKRSRVCATCIELLLGSVLALESGFHATRCHRWRERWMHNWSQSIVRWRRNAGYNWAISLCTFGVLQSSDRSNIANPSLSFVCFLKLRRDHRVNISIFSFFLLRVCLNIFRRSNITRWTMNR